MIKLLIADDEYWVRENIKNMLDWGKYGIELCEAACDGEDALQKLESLRPHILITDINMPFISGVELIQKAKAQYPELVVITLSGFSDYEYVRKTLLAGAIDYLLKPLDQDALSGIIQKAIGVISNRNAHKKEQEDIDRSLTLARSLIRDREFSALIADENFSPDIPEFELRFSAYTLILIKLGRLPGMRMNEAFTGRLRAALELAAKPFSPIIVNNMYAPNEFILLCSAEPRAGFCSKLLEALAFARNPGVGIGVSRRYASFAQLKKAYNEASSALLARNFTNANAVLLIEDAEKLRVQKRITPQQENELTAFLKNRNKARLRNLVFNDIGIKGCGAWLFVEVKQAINRIAWLIGQGISSDKPGARAFMTDELAEMLSMALESLDPAEVCGVLEQMIDAALGTDENRCADSARQTVKKLLGYIDENYFESMSLGSLAQRFLIEQSYLSRIFKQETGENLIFYINKKRVERAIKYMLERKRHLSEISYLVGFDDYAYFNRVFRKIIGKSPSEYMRAAEKPVNPLGS